jgi:hypothetical protein
VVSLGGEEGQGQLALLAELNRRVQELESTSGGASDGGSTDTTLLSWVALGVAVVALAVSLLRRRA